MEWKVMLSAILFSTKLISAVTHSCLQSVTTGEVSFRNGDATDHIPTERQVIVASSKFQCCGNITRWQLHTHYPCVDSITFQVWRPESNPAMDRCFVLIGEDNYDVRVNEGGAVNRTLERRNFISVQSGDVVGFYITRQGCTSEEVEQPQPDDVAEGEEVWYSADGSSDRYRTETRSRDRERSQNIERGDTSDSLGDKSGCSDDESESSDDESESSDDESESSDDESESSDDESESSDDKSESSDDESESSDDESESSDDESESSGDESESSESESSDDEGDSPGSPQCQTEAAPSETLVLFANSASVVSVDIDEYPCPRSPPTLPSSPLTDMSPVTTQLQESLTATIAPPTAAVKSNTAANTKTSGPISSTPNGAKQRLGITGSIAAGVSTLVILLVTVPAVLYAVISKRKARKTADRSSSGDTTEVIQVKVHTSTQSLPTTYLNNNAVERAQGSPDENDSLTYDYIRSAECKCHVTTSDQIHAMVEGEQQQQDKDDGLVYNNAYITNTNHIQLKPNQCYGITATTVDPEKQPILEGEQDNELVYNNAYVTSAPHNLADYDYILI